MTFIFAGGTGCCQVDANIDACAACDEITGIGLPELIIVGVKIWFTAGNVNKGKSIIPGACACISDCPYFLEISAGFNGLAIRNGDIAFKNSVIA